MTFTPQNVPVPNRQRSLLAAVMLVILLACVGGAWWLVEARTEQPEQAAQEVLAEIRTQKLSHFWPGKSHRKYYAVNDPHGKTVGWAAFAYERTDNGYRGWRVDSMGRLERWELDDAATTGTYVRPTSTASVTRIVLKEQTVSVDLAARGAAAGPHAVAPIPPTYMPEGLTHLIIRLVAQRGKDAMFSTILANKAIFNEQVSFCIVKMKPTGRMVEVQTQMYDGVIVERFFLDEEGQVSGFREGDKSYQLSTGDALLKRFPGDEFLRRLAQEPEFVPSPENTTAPADEPQEKEVARIDG